MSNELMTLETVQAQEEIPEIQTRAKTLAANAARLTVKDDASSQKATDFLVEVKKAIKKAESVRKSFTGPLQQSKKAIDGFFKKLKRPYEEAESVVKGKLRDYALEQERLRKEEEARLEKERQEREAEQARIAAEAAEKGEAPPEVEEGEITGDAPVVVPAKTVRGMEGGSASMKKVWKFAIVDREAVPCSYWTVDEKAIQKAVNLGARDIPGVKIFEDVQVAVRT